MRFAVFLAVIAATFVACTSNFAQASTLAKDYAEDLVLLNQAEENVDRRLRGAVGPVSKDKVANIAGGFIEKLRVDATLNKALWMVQFDKVDDAAVKKAVRLASTAKEKAKLSDEAMAKLLKITST
ncbi:hypothetical protein V7S43_004630 [Phytophthora oleae]|uniref:RxLR effector protein n=1 Tax=Phytophthora oleae TaxID=2107226 RepID=A0ABD3FVS4_9STRA